MEIIDKKVLEDIRKEEALEKKNKKKNFSYIFKEFVYEKLNPHINNFQHKKTLALLNIYYKKNKKFLNEEERVKIIDYIFNNNQKILNEINDIEKCNMNFYKELKKEELLVIDQSFEIAFQRVMAKKELEKEKFSEEKEELKEEEKEEEKNNEDIDLEKSKKVYTYDYDTIKIESLEDTMVYNIDENEISKNNIDFSKYSFSDLFILCLKVTISNFHFICILLSIFYFFSNSGIIAIFIPIILFVTILVEETRPGLNAWKFAFLFFLLISLLKTFFNLEVISKSLNQSIVAVRIFRYKY